MTLPLLAGRNHRVALCSLAATALLATAAAGGITSPYGTWQAMPSRPTAIEPVDDQGMVYVPANRSLYLAQGNNNLGRGFARYSFDTGTWTQLADSPGPSHSGDVVYGGGDLVYVTSPQNASFWHYSISADTWQSLAAPPDTSFTGAVLANGYIYAMQRYASVLWRYSIAANTWQALSATAPGSVVTGSIAWDGGDYLYVSQGHVGTGFYRYSISGNTWATLAPTPAATSYQTGTYLDGYVFWLASGRTQDFWAYDVAAGTWITDLPDIPSEVFVIETLTTDGKDLYFVNNSQLQDGKFYRYVLPQTTFTPGDVYVAGNQVYPNRFINVTSGGNLSGATPLATINRCPGQIAWSADLNTAYVTEYDVDRVVAVSPSGTVTVFATGIDGPTGLLRTDDGRLLVVSFGTDRVLDISAGGRLLIRCPVRVGVPGPPQPAAARRRQDPACRSGPPCRIRHHGWRRLHHSSGVRPRFRRHHCGSGTGCRRASVRIATRRWPDTRYYCGRQFCGRDALCLGQDFHGANR